MKGPTLDAEPKPINNPVSSSTITKGIIHHNFRSQRKAKNSALMDNRALFHAISAYPHQAKV